MATITMTWTEDENATRTGVREARGMTARGIPVHHPGRQDALRPISEDAAMTRNPRWTHRPPGSTWGDFGPDDQLGRLNLLTKEKVLQGIAEVREGRTFCLSL